MQLQFIEDEEPKAEPKFEQAEEKEEESGLQDYSDKVQKRIKKLTFQAKEAERRERAAVEYAKGLKNKYEVAEKKFEVILIHSASEDLSSLNSIYARNNKDPQICEP